MSHSFLRGIFATRSTSLAVFALSVIVGHAQADPVPIYRHADYRYRSMALNDLGQVAGYVTSPGGNTTAVGSSGSVTVLVTMRGGGRIYVAGINNSGL